MGKPGRATTRKADRAAVRKKKRGQKDSERSRGVLSPRLELGISRVSGGRINQLSHESAFSLRSLSEGGPRLIMYELSPARSSWHVSRSSPPRTALSQRERPSSPPRTCPYFSALAPHLVWRHGLRLKFGRGHSLALPSCMASWAASCRCRLLHIALKPSHAKSWQRCFYTEKQRDALRTEAMPARKAHR